MNSNKKKKYRKSSVFLIYQIISITLTLLVNNNSLAFQSYHPTHFSSLFAHQFYHLPTYYELPPNPHLHSHLQQPIIGSHNPLLFNSYFQQQSTPFPYVSFHYKVPVLTLQQQAYNPFMLPPLSQYNLQTYANIGQAYQPPLYITRQQHYSRNYPAPIYHVDNSDHGQPNIGSTISIPQNAFYDNSTIKLYPRNETTKIKIHQNNSDIFSLISPNFYKSYYKIIQRANGEIQAVRINYSETQKIYQENPRIQLLKNSYQLNRMTLEQLAQHLSQAQIQSSGTTKDSNIGQMAAANIFKINTLLAEKIYSTKPLALHDLQTWNTIINHNTINSDISPTVGIVRGTQSNSRDPRYTSIDLSSAQMAATTIGGETAWHYLPAHQVPARLEILIARVNALTKHSSLKDIAEIYRDYIVIHPFTEGNGRTARALIDYALIAKLKMPPLPPNTFLPRDIIGGYNSLDEVAQHISNLYLTNDKN